MSAKYAPPTLMINHSLNPNEKLVDECIIPVPFRTRVETSLVTSHTDAPQEPELLHKEDIIWKGWVEGGYESSHTDFITYLIIFLLYRR